MDTTLSIAIDGKSRITATGVVSVGEKVAVTITGLSASLVPEWGSDDDFTGKSLRFRIIDPSGRDLVRFPLRKKTETNPDTWTVSGDVFTAVVDFNTQHLRDAFGNFPSGERMDFGVVVDSVVDAVQYGCGRAKIRQWVMCPTEDPTVLPDWRETLANLKTALDGVTAASSAATAAATSAASSAATATTAASTATTQADVANTRAVEATEQKRLAQAAKSAAEAAQIAAEVAVTHYPKIGSNEHWLVWDTATGEYVDTGCVANGGHNIFNGKVFARPSNAKGWYELLCYVITEMGGNIQTEGITPGSEPSSINMKATDGTSKSLRIVKSGDEYTTEVV